MIGGTIYGAMSADELNQLHELLDRVTEDLGKPHNLSHLEYEVLRLAGGITHDLYMATKYPNRVSKLETGGTHRQE